LLIVFAFLFPITDVLAADASRRVLILSGYKYTLPSATQVINGIQQRLNERAPEVAIDGEFLDLVRGADPGHELRTATFLREKYALAPPDLVIAVGGATLQFVMKHGDIIAPHIPIVFSGISPATLAAVRPPSSMTGLIAKLDLEKTVDLAERLQPSARRLFVIAGDSPVEDRQWQETARRTLEPLGQKFETSFLFGLSYEALLSEASRIPPDAIVIMLSFQIDGAGKAFVGRNVAKAIAQVSPAPVYTPYDSYIGDGVVGGFVETFRSHGTATADMAIEILAGKDPATIPVHANPEQAFRVDARALERWGLKRSNLPPGSVVLFHEPTVWEQHRALISAIALVIALQSIAVAAFNGADGGKPRFPSGKATSA